MVKNILTLLIVLIIFFLLKQYVVGFFIIQSESMIPTLNKGDIVLISKNAYLLNEPKKGEIITFIKNNKILVKRIESKSKGKFYLLGDNPKNSIDSRYFGDISRDSIIGKVILKFNNSGLELVR